MQLQSNKANKKKMISKQKTVLNNLYLHRRSVSMSQWKKEKSSFKESNWESKSKRDKTNQLGVS